jgi:hypothetical protein
MSYVITLHPEAQALFDEDMWGQHPDYPRTDWKYEVSNGDTNLGYWEWLTGMLTD